MTQNRQKTGTGLMEIARSLPVIDLPTARDEEAWAITRASHGDRTAFELIYRQHAGWVFGLCLRLTGQRELAEDCTQETFIAAWRGLSGFQKRSQFSTWLHRIAVNSVLARRRRPGDSGPSDDEAHGAEQPNVTGDMDAAGPVDLERAIAALPRGARDVLVLVGIYGYSHDEAGTMLGVASGTCKAQLHRARELLSARLNLTEYPR
jgi:RNA polymerase sigma-70 factor (ECF subfamily)